MLPGLSTKLSEETLASAATIAPSKDIVILTGTTNVVNITPPRNGGFPTMVILCPVDGTVNTTAAGNIAKAMAIPQNQSCLLVYSKKRNKWYPSAIS